MSMFGVAYFPTPTFFTILNVRTHKVLEIHEIKFKSCLMSADLPS